jgi:23S rRNA G2445 N2-methylase RlmL
MPGALNATAAHAMVALSNPRSDEIFVNIACGSATLLIERLHLTSVGRAVGYDIDAAALDCARANVGAAGLAPSIELHTGDARQLPLESGSVRTVVADLPYAMLLGTAETNRELYPDLLHEAARVLMPGGRCIVVTTQRRLMEDLVDPWEILARVPFSVPHARGTINPTIYALRKP